jgi:hypothetical protein
LRCCVARGRPPGEEHSTSDYASGAIRRHVDRLRRCPRSEERRLVRSSCPRRADRETQTPLPPWAARTNCVWRGWPRQVARPLLRRLVRRTVCAHFASRVELRLSKPSPPRSRGSRPRGRRCAYRPLVLRQVHSGPGSLLARWRRAPLTLLEVPTLDCFHHSRLQAHSRHRWRRHSWWASSMYHRRWARRRWVDWRLRRWALHSSLRMLLLEARIRNPPRCQARLALRRWTSRWMHSQTCWWRWDGRALLRSLRLPARLPDWWLRLCWSPMGCALLERRLPYRRLSRHLADFAPMQVAPPTSWGA